MASGPGAGAGAVSPLLAAVAGGVSFSASDTSTPLLLVAAVEEARLERNVSLKVILRESCLLRTEFSREKKIRPSPPGQ